MSLLFDRRRKALKEGLAALRQDFIAASRAYHTKQVPVFLALHKEADRLSSDAIDLRRDRLRDAWMPGVVAGLAGLSTAAFALTISPVLAAGFGAIGLVTGAAAAVTRVHDVLMHDRETIYCNRAMTIGSRAFEWLVAERQGDRIIFDRDFAAAAALDCDNTIPFVFEDTDYDLIEDADKSDQEYPTNKGGFGVISGKHRCDTCHSDSLNAREYYEALQKNISTKLNF